MFTVRLKQFTGHILSNLDRLLYCPSLCHESWERFTGCQVLPVFYLLYMKSKSVFLCHSFVQYTPMTLISECLEGVCSELLLSITLRYLQPPYQRRDDTEKIANSVT